MSQDGHLSLSQRPLPSREQVQGSCCPFPGTNPGGAALGPPSSKLKKATWREPLGTPSLAGFLPTLLQTQGLFHCCNRDWMSNEGTTVPFKILRLRETCREDRTSPVVLCPGATPGLYILPRVDSAVTTMQGVLWRLPPCAPFPNWKHLSCPTGG